jgi:hypothetical protein
MLLALIEDCIRSDASQIYSRRSRTPSSEVKRQKRAAGIKVGLVFLLQLMTSFQIRVGETGGVHHVGHAVYYCLDRCCRTQPTRNHYRVHISRILTQDY